MTGRGIRITTFAIVVAALGGLIYYLLANDAPGRPDRDGVLEIVMADYAFDVDDLHVPAETPLTLRFINEDEVTHHVSFGREIVEQDGRAVGFETDLLEGHDVLVRPATALVELDAPYRGRSLELRGGQQVEMDVVFPADKVGTWQVGCFTGRGCHLRAGLDATLTIE